MNQSPGQNIKIDIQNPTPIMTICLVFVFFFVFYLMIQNSRLEFLVPHLPAQKWMQQNGVNAVNIYKLFQNAEYTKILAHFATSSFASFAGWQLALNSYFLWVFAAPVEQKMGSSRFLMLAFLAVLLPWAVLCYERLGAVDDTVYYGSIFLVATMIGAGMVFPEEKEINEQWFKKTRGEIFSRKEQKRADQVFKINAQLLYIFFILYQAGSYYFSIKVTEGFMTFHLVPLFVSVLIGYLVTMFLVWSATGDLKEGALKLVVLRRYNDMIKLDINHEVAIRSVSMALGLPEERVRQWVREKRGKMRVS